MTSEIHDLAGAPLPSDGSPRALVVSSDFPFPTVSGNRKRDLRLLEAIERAGARPHILTFAGKPQQLDEAHRRGWGVEIFEEPQWTLRNRIRVHARQEPLPWSAAFAERVAELARDAAFVQFEEVDSIHYVPARSPGGTPMAASLHNVDSSIRLAHARQAGASGRKATYWARRTAATEKRAARRVDALFCVSDHDLRHFRSCGARNPLLVPNGVDDQLFALDASAAPNERVFFFGQFAWQPNVDGMRRFLAEIWPRIAEQRRDARLRIAGPGSTELFSEQAARLERVEVLGFVDDLEQELQDTRVVVAPLWTGGGTRIKVLEALAAGRPVVGTSLGVEEIGFEHGRHGLIADTAEGIADEVIRLLSDPALSERLAEQGRELVEGLRWSVATKPAEDLYRQWIARSQGPARQAGAQHRA